jgi:Translationally controlled tumour protein
MFSDAYDMKLVDDIVYEVECKMITIRKGADVGVYTLALSRFFVDTSSYKL